MSPQKPDNTSAEEWEAVQKAIRIVTEYFPNIAVFLNWVDDKGATQHCHILQGNTFALQNHVCKWADGDFDEQGNEPESIEFDDDDEGEEYKNKNPKK